jgi:YHS domain-containing protein
MRRSLIVPALVAAAGLGGSALLFKFAPAHAESCPNKPAAADSKVPASFASKPAPGTKARCPVSNEEFTVKANTATATFNGRVYAFCCADCKPDFEKNPAKYAR